MESKYAGKCQVCQNAWNAGDNIFYQGTPKVICANKECFLDQGGKEYTGGSFSGGSGGRIKAMDAKISDIIELDEQIAKIATERLSKVEAVTGKLEPEQRLVFIESWARTLTMSFNQR